VDRLLLVGDLPEGGVLRGARLNASDLRQRKEAGIVSKKDKTQ
jgi:hypothetical protein